MPTASIDTFFACSLLVILIVSSMAVLPRILDPFFDRLANRSEDELLHQLDQYILLGTGAPSDWGNHRSVSPSDFGLALDTPQPYAIDADKVTRLNSRNTYAITYVQLLDSLRISNVALRIQIQTLFETFINLTSGLNNGNATSYSFEITTQNSGLVVASDLSCYIVIRDYVNNVVHYTDSNGKALANFTIPNNLSGSALLAVFAKARADPNIVSFGVYSFGHNAPTPKEEGTFMRLNPLNYVLNVSHNYADEQVLGAYAFSYSYWANLTVLSNLTQTTEYSFPCFRDKSATILVLTGLNHTRSFAEWEAYPQIPLVIGVNFDASSSSSNIASNDYVVKINAALYKLRIQSRRVG